MTSTISLRDYRMLYPGTDTEPSLTQMGLIGFLLERSRQRELRKARRRDARRRFILAMLRPWVFLREISRKIVSSSLATPTQVEPGVRMHRA